MPERVLVATCAAFVLCGCTDATLRVPDCTAPAREPSQPARLCDLDAAAVLAPSDAAANIRLGLYFTVPWAKTPRHPWTAADAEARANEALAHTAAIYAACDIGLELLSAEVIAVPAAMQKVEGNVADSWGGQAPDGVDADAFNHARGERLAEDPRALFAMRAGLPDGALAVFVVDDIVYHAAQVLTPAGGLSFAPVVFHHADDFPWRNAVLAAGAYAGLGEIPARVNGRTIAHELGHMLLDTGSHVSAENAGDPHNLMLEGDAMVEEQCQIMRDNLSWLYGDSPVIDPLDPSG